MTTFKESRDIESFITHNKMEILTDPYITKSYIVNGQEVATWPRLIQGSGRGQDGVAITPGVQFSNSVLALVWGISFTNNTFNTSETPKQPLLSYPGYIRAINSTHLVFEQGGYWYIQASLKKVGGGALATGQGLKIELQESGDSGSSWTTRATNYVYQPDAGAIPPLDTVMCSYEFYVLQGAPPNQTQRIRIMGTTNNWNANVDLFITAIRRR